MMKLREYIQAMMIKPTIGTMGQLIDEWIDELIKATRGSPLRIQHDYAQHLNYLKFGCQRILVAFKEYHKAMAGQDAAQKEAIGSFYRMIDQDFETTLARMAPRPAVMTKANEFRPHSGIAFMGYFVCKGDPELAKWLKRTCYNATHPFGREDDYVSKKRGAQKWDVKGNPDLSAAIAAKKPAAAKVELLLGKNRHAEDGWFAYHYKEFLADVAKHCSAKPVGAEPANVYARLWALPRIEFIDTCVPCRTDANDDCSGCREYFRVLREDLTKTIANGKEIPILIFAYKPYEMGSADFEVYSVDSNGALRLEPVNWSPS